MRRIRFCGVFALAMMLSAAAFGQQSREGLNDPNQPDMSITATMRNEAIATLESLLVDQYIFPDVADKLVAMLERRKASGAYEKITSAKEFRDVLTADMNEIAHDGHLRVFYSAAVLGGSAARNVQAPQKETRLKFNNYDFDEVARLPGNIGYLNFHGFTDLNLSGDTLAAAMAFLANTDAMIIDLRNNSGSDQGGLGMPETLASYFFRDDAPPQHLNDISWRMKGTKEYRLVQQWTLPYLPGERYLDKEVYILTSRTTYSAAEGFTYGMKALNRVTLVGERTGGGANPGTTNRLSEHFAAFIPIGQVINSITKGNWEGTGIKPDLETPVADALKVAHRTALQHLIDKTTDKQRLSWLEKALTEVDEARVKDRP